MTTYIHDELVLVLDEYVHLHLIDNFVDFEITSIGLGLKNRHINMCILCFEIFDQLHDELVLVLDEYVHLPLVLNFVDFEITFIGFGLKKLAINLCIRLIILHLLLWTEMGEVYKGRVTLCGLCRLVKIDIVSSQDSGMSSKEARWIFMTPEK